MYFYYTFTTLSNIPLVVCAHNILREVSTDLYYMLQFFDRGTTGRNS